MTMVWTFFHGSFINENVVEKSTMAKRNVAIFVFNDVEVLDFAGPFEVFSVTTELNNYEYFDAYTVAEKPAAITAVNGLSVNPKYDFTNCPRSA